ncbi:di-heme oxidoredictase family protein [Arcobacter sp. YIC-464]|uniref:di-heme oxidoredictase family protein n=1 Tax=Arcobacter sp. YIC-464 TaxID=3376631 RepID=UPI003C234F80
MQKRQKFNLSLLQKALLSKSLVAIFATGLFAVNTEGKYFSSEKNSSLLQKPVSGLSDEQYDQFILGRSFFVIPWVEAPSATTARDGLGPLFNSNTCVSCHPKNGRGNLYNNKMKPSRSLVARLSIPSNSSKEHKEYLEKQGFVPEPTYGSQISVNGIHGVPFEARVDVKFEELKVTFPDGEVDTILKPKYELIDKNYGELAKNTAVTYRMAPSLNGLGLLEKVSDEEILSNEDEFDKDGDGISGRANRVYSPLTKKEEIGRYTWKASSATIMEQIAGAANNDMGLTTFLNPNENCTSSQKLCNEAPKALHEKDITDMRLGAIDFYIRNLKTYKNKADEKYNSGLKLFTAMDCAKCHKTELQTVDGFKISPFTDMLLHDMGEGLSDGRVEFKANEREFRTAPLWGLALHEKINGEKPRLLHDGRARNFQEAILWHGGEAKISKQKYMNASKEQREKLIEFLERL